MKKTKRSLGYRDNKHLILEARKEVMRKMIVPKELKGLIKIENGLIIVRMPKFSKTKTKNENTRFNIVA